MANPFKKRSNFVERSIMGTLSFLRESVFSEEFASKKGFLQLIDPRIKAVAFILLLILIMLAQEINSLIFLYLFCLLLAVFSRINIGFFLKRTWIFIPLFSIFIALPIIITQGVQSASFFILRVLASVSFVVLLSITTRHTELLRVLRIFGVPQVFVLTISMCYRYIFLFIGILENTYLALKSRTGFNIHYKRGQKIVAWNIASLWQRSFHLYQEVYSAMLSRGYSGEPKV
ncbi:MAG: cobalt ECF transporter T component CbiQ [Candidatus Firestonebacteria bacterium]